MRTAPSMDVVPLVKHATLPRAYVYRPRPMGLQLPPDRHAVWVLHPTFRPALAPSSSQARRASSGSRWTSTSAPSRSPQRSPTRTTTLSLRKHDGYFHPPRSSLLVLSTKNDAEPVLSYAFMTKVLDVVNAIYEDIVYTDNATGLTYGFADLCALSGNATPVPPLRPPP